MPQLSPVKTPKNYFDYLFWRAEHQKYALYVMFCAGIYALFRWF